MNVTEQQAKEKWCPMARVYNEGSGADNRTMGDANPGHARCIGSECMMWTWDGQYAGGTTHRKFVLPGDQFAAVEPPRPQYIPSSWEFLPFSDEDGDQACWIEPQEEYEARRLGRCGLTSP